ncbi:hypothetical protein ACQR18_10640 [Bradyrhizobium oligotrophicum]|uniref:hypothetical protein n=1 Tax=Bradyrhizobium oligotrophicum TaxID=44255 RepID=UPI003EB770FD
MSRLSKLALLTLGALAAGAAMTGASARETQWPGCELVSWTACGTDAQVQQSQRRQSRDTSPIYMKQTDPRYSGALTAAGGDGGGGGGGGGGR